jgi:hypothetical protein
VSVASRADAALVSTQCGLKFSSIERGKLVGMRTFLAAMTRMWWHAMHVTQPDVPATHAVRAAEVHLLGARFDDEPEPLGTARHTLGQGTA